MLNLEEAIIKTICWFDIFDYPLTLYELWSYLYLPLDKRDSELQKVDLSFLKRQLENNPNLKKSISCQEGFYFLRGREEIVKIRKRRFNIAENKFKKSKRIIKILRLFPFIRMIAVCNTLAYRGAREGSDIDIFIITAKKRIWLARFFSLIFLSILNLRPKENDLKDKICLSFFISEDHLDLREVTKKEYDDIYLVYWISQLIPFYNHKVYHLFYQKNFWIKDYLPFIQEKLTGERFYADLSYFAKTIKKSLEFLINFFGGNRIEKFLSSLQMKKLPPKIKEKSNQGVDVVVKEGILKFHLNDRRDTFYRLWKNKLEYVQKTMGENY